MIYTYRGNEIKALPFHDTTETIDALVTLVEVYNVSINYKYGENPTMTVHAPNKLVLTPGDYLAKFPNGSLKVYTATDFNNKFVKLG